MLHLTPAGGVNIAPSSDLIVPDLLRVGDTLRPGERLTGNVAFVVTAPMLGEGVVLDARTAAGEVPVYLAVQ